MTFLDAVLKGGIAGPPGPAGESGAIADALAAAVDLPETGLKLFNDPVYGLSSKHASGAIREVSPDIWVHVSRFVPIGERLTTANFEAALLAAVAFVEALPHCGGVLIPSGHWPMTGELMLSGFGYVKPMATLRGAGRQMTRLIWPAEYTGICVRFEGFAVEGDANFPTRHASHGGIEDLDIVAPYDNGRGIGLFMRQAYRCAVRRVNIRGFGASRNNGITEGIGIWVDGNRNGQPGYDGLHNTQHIMFDEVECGGCTTGMRLRSLTQPKCIMLQLNQNRFCDMLLEGANMFEARQCMFQSYGAGDKPNNPYYGNPFWAVRTWGDPIKSGTGGIAGTPSIPDAPNSLVTITGLTGMVTADVGRWLLLEGAADVRENGTFEIIEYVSATSVKIRKANGIGSTGLVWSVVACIGSNQVTFSGKVYHEGPYAGFLRQFRAESGLDEFIVEDLYTWNTDTVLTLDGNWKLVLRDPMFSPDVCWVDGKLGKRLEVCGISETPASHPARFKLDSYTERNTYIAGPAGTYSPAPGSRRLIDLLAPYAVEIWDSRYGVVVASDGSVVSWTGMLNGSVLNPLSGALGSGVTGAGSQYTPSNPDFGGKPTLGQRRTATLARSMKGTLAVPVAIGERAGLVAVYGAGRGYLPGNWTPRGPAIYSTDISRAIRCAYDDADSVGVITTPLNFADGNLGPTRPLPAGRPAMVLVQQHQDDSGTYGYAVFEGNVNNVAAASGLTQPLDKAITTVALSGEPGGGDTYTNTGEVPFLCVLKKAMPFGVVKAVLEVLAETYPGQQGRAMLPTLTASAAYAQDASINCTIPVSLTAADVTIPLPLGHKRGDWITFVVTTAAAGHSLTLDPAGSETISGASTLVLNTDYAYCTIQSDGTNWLRIG